MSTPSPLVLVIEDDPQIRKFLRATLTGHQYRVIEAETAKAGLLSASTQPPDAIILDLGLPDLDGLEVTKQLRSWTRIPILVLSARGHEKDKVEALDAGADDYIAKPFSVGELMARIRVALRHASESASSSENPIFKVGELKVDLARRQVFLGEKEVHLTALEYRLVTMFVQHAGKVLTHRQLLRQIWGPAYEDQVQYLRVYMAQLRRKLEADPAQPKYFLTEQGVGYRLICD